MLNGGIVHRLARRGCVTAAVLAGAWAPAAHAITFSPHVAVSADTSVAGAAAAVTVALSQDPPGAGRSTIRSVRLTMPEGLSLSATLGNRLAVCAPEQFELADWAAPVRCATDAKIADVTAEQGAVTVTGAGYLGPPQLGPAGDRYPLFVAVTVGSQPVKFAGTITIGGAGRPATEISAAFDDLPDLNIDRLAFAFRGGDDAALALPMGCGVHTGAAVVRPWAGGIPGIPPDGAVVAPPPELTVSLDGAGGCRLPRAFEPSVAADLTGNRAGGSPALRLVLRRADRTQRFAAFDATLPPGLIASMAAVPPCRRAAAAAGTCPAEARVGAVRVGVGGGPRPLGLPGDVYLTQGVGGDPAGLAIVIRAAVGPLDLGRAVIFARARVLSGPVRMQVVTDQLPRVHRGIPLDVREIELRLDRPGFLRAPTSCTPAPIAVTAAGLEGSTATAAAPVAATGCRALRFRPRLAVRTGARGETGPGRHPPVAVEVLQPAGGAGMRTASIALPSALAVDLGRLTAACPLSRFTAGTCRRGAIGRASAQTPILPRALSGTVYLVRDPGQPLPRMGLDLRGAVPLKLLGDIDVSAAGIRTVFRGGQLPDVPVRRLSVALFGGRRGVVSAAGDLCRGRQRAAARFTAFSGARASVRARVGVAGCRRAPSRPSAGPRPAVRVPATAKESP